MGHAFKFSMHSPTTRVDNSNFDALITYIVITITYSSLILRVKKSSSTDGVSDVERMIIASISRVIPSVNEELVVVSSLHYQLWDDSVVNEPGNTPARST